MPGARSDDSGKWFLRPPDEIVENLGDLATRFVRGEFGSESDLYPEERPDPKA